MRAKPTWKLPTGVPGARARAPCGVSAGCMGTRLELEGKPPCSRQRPLLTACTPVPAGRGEPSVPRSHRSTPPEGKEGVFGVSGPTVLSVGEGCFHIFLFLGCSCARQAMVLRKCIMIAALQKWSLHQSIRWPVFSGEPPGWPAAQDSAEPRGPGPSCTWIGGSHPALSCPWGSGPGLGKKALLIFCAAAAPDCLVQTPSLAGPHTLLGRAVSPFRFLLRLLGANHCLYGLPILPWSSGGVVPRCFS